MVKENQARYLSNTGLYACPSRLFRGIRHKGDYDDDTDAVSIDNSLLRAIPLTNVHSYTSTVKFKITRHIPSPIGLRLINRTKISMI